MIKAETIFFQVLSDLKEYLESLVLVGGWVPYIYAKYLWRETKTMPLGTSDIDIGIEKIDQRLPSKTIYEKLSSRYKQRHFRMDRPFRDIVLVLENTEIHFISTEDISKRITKHLTGEQLRIEKVKYFEILTNNKISIPVIDDKKDIHKIYVPKPSAFLFHKGLTFINRDYEEKKAKDLYYMYYILRFSPEVDRMLSELDRFRKNKKFKNFQDNIKTYFERISSNGCLMVEKENGPDDYIDNLREDVFKRFKQLYQI